MSVVADGATGSAIAVDGFMARFLSRFGVSPGTGRLPRRPAQTIARSGSPTGRAHRRDKGFVDSGERRTQYAR